MVHREQKAQAQPDEIIALVKPGHLWKLYSLIVMDDLKNKDHQSGFDSNKEKPIMQQK